LHPSKSFVVALLMLPSGLAQHITSYVLGASALSRLGVSVRISILADGGNYLPMPALRVRDPDPKRHRDATYFPYPKIGECSDFPPSTPQCGALGNHPTQRLAHYST